MSEAPSSVPPARHVPDFGDTAVWLTPSDVLEYLYCPRFLYFERVLGIPEHQELRPKVQIGREVHQQREHRNPHYLRKRLGVVEKVVDAELHSLALGLSGRVDEVLFLQDGSAAPLDYKFAEWTGSVYLNLVIQNVLYGLTIEERYGKLCSRGYVVYVRTDNHVEEVAHTAERRTLAAQVLSGMREVISRGRFPPATRYTKRCNDCCYRRVCPR